jgi:RNA polymerase sigma-70 factor, ECF subfamily
VQDSEPRSPLDPDLDTLRALADAAAAACRRLVDRHLGGLHAFAARMLGDPAEAEDVCQESFMKLWQQAARWEADRARVSTWLYQVALNACRDRLRRQRPQVADDPDLLQSPQPQPARQAEAEQRAGLLHAAIAELPPRQREALLLFHFEGHSQADTAAVLEVSEDALESLLARARRGLRERLEGIGPATAEDEHEHRD